MLPDFNFLRRNAAKIAAPHPHNENLHSIPAIPAAPDSDPSRPPLTAIQDAIPRLKPDKPPPKPPTAIPGLSALFRTPEKPAGRSRFGWCPSPSTNPEASDDTSSQLPPRSGIVTPRLYRGKASSTSSLHSDCSSMQSTPTKSVTKPYSRPPLGLGPRTACFSAEVPHFELREDPDFWLEHSVQVVIRVRPLGNTEKSLQGYSRCLKQESAHSLTWIGQPETRFTFDYVACESINQEMLFRVTGLQMVENCMSGYNCCMFAYGQTGSGKTYTMLGEIGELEIKPSIDRGMTPRIFEFLFARIKAEEESRMNEKLRYSCKCSFLEIYNEQITDLLDPSSTNLLLREDLRKGVYVENLSEFEVKTVNDIVKLLIQGAANRKVAATNMNRESSRSHSVFTCVIESRWVKDSTSNLRFARLNLVDLAGSERQKTSGAEGERLKEAANINKSLSTLGHVIMMLADDTHGKQKHIPYRDSRLTFLLQDSLGGNSKTIIMANVTPSICSANETLSTLKFAQRARLIQNNAVVNEDTSGDVVALQHQIRILKDELSAIKRANIPRSLSFRLSMPENSDKEPIEDSASKKLPGRFQMNDGKFEVNEASCSIRVSSKQLKSLEATLAGSLRREKMADITIKQLEAEIEQLNRLVRQREEDTQCSKMKLKFREDKIHRMKALVDGLVPTDTYLVEENTALSEEIQLLRTRVDRNPEVTRFALENIRLLDQLRRLQEFYEEGERELLLTEVSELRNQLTQFLDAKSEHDPSQKDTDTLFSNSMPDNKSMSIELKRTCQELDDCSKNLKACLETNAKLTREINNLRIELNNIQSSSHDQHCQNMDPQVHTMKVVNHAEEILKLQLELDTLKTIIEAEKSSRVEVEDKIIHASHELQVANDTITQINKLKESLINELKDAKAVIEALESEHVIYLKELDDLRNHNKYSDLLRTQEQETSKSRKWLGVQFEGEGKVTFPPEELKDLSPKQAYFDNSPLQVKLKRMQASVEMVCSLNMRYQTDQASQTSIEQEMEEIRRQVEVETAEVIVCLQEELMSLQQQASISYQNELEAKRRLDELETEINGMHERLSLATQDNETLQKLLEEKETSLRSLNEDWESFAREIGDVLANGYTCLEDASDQISFVSNSVPQRSWISENIGRLTRGISERDASIEELQRCLEDAQNARSDMEWKLRSLRGAMLAVTEAQQQETSDREQSSLLLTSQLSERGAVVTGMESRIELGEEKIRRSEICATVAFMVVNKLSETNKGHLQELENVKAALNELEEKCFHKDALIQHHASMHTNTVRQMQLLQLQLEQSQKHTAELKHAQEQEETSAFERKRQQEEKEDIALSIIVEDLLKAKRVINEIKTGMCSVNVEKVCSFVAVQGSQSDADNNSEHVIKIISTQDAANFKSHNAQSVSGGSTCNPCSRLLEDNFDRDAMFVLLSKEIESTLDSLKDIQHQMFKLLEEKEEMKKSEAQCRESMEHLSVEVLRLKSDISDKEQQCSTRLIELESQLQTVEGNAVTSNECWLKAKKALELEVSDANSVAAQKTEESSNLLRKIEDAQETMRDANIMVDALVEANELLKLEIERHQESETQLNNEKRSLISEIHSLKSSLNRKEHELEYIQKSFQLKLTEGKSIVLALEDAFRHMDATYAETFELITSDIDYLKQQFHQYTSFARTWLEDTWSEIIERDCAVSVLHLCHMGILLERITGLNAENGFLYRGLCKSNSVICDLRQHNTRAKKDLGVCSLLKEKLLLDINNSFNRISKKENETAEFKAKLNSFEQKILFLQSQEESMLARSNSIANELSILMKELDSANKNRIMEVSMKEKLLGENKELRKKLKETSQLLEEEKGIHRMLRNSLCEELNLFSVKSSANLCVKIDMKSCNMRMNQEPEFYQKLIESFTDSLLRNMLAKDFELLVVASELENKCVESNDMALQTLDLRRQINTLKEVIEDIKNELLIHTIDGELNNIEMRSLLVDKEELKTELLKLKEDHLKTIDDLQEAKSGLASSMSQVNLIQQKNDTLRDTICSMDACNTALQVEVDSKKAELEEIQCSHTVSTEELNTELLKLKEDHLRNIENLQEAKLEVESSLTHINLIQQKNDQLQDTICSMDACNTTLQAEVDSKRAELEEIQCSHTVSTNELKTELLKLKEDHLRAIEDLQEVKLALESSMSDMNLIQQKNEKLEDTICSLDAYITTLQAEVDSKRAELEEIQFSHTVSTKELDLKNAITEVQLKRISSLEAENDSLQNEVNVISKDLVSKNEAINVQVQRINALEVENGSLKNKADTFRRKKDEIITSFNFKMKRLLDKSDTLDMALDKMLHVTDEHVSRLTHAQSQEILENKETASEFVDKLEFLTLSAEELISDKFSLQSELMHKDEVIKGLLFDLSLIQESESIAKDQNNQLQEMNAALETLEDELASKSAELDEVVAQAQIHESELVEKDKRISALELEIDETYDKLNLISSENLELKDFVKHVVDMKDTLEHEVKQRTEVTERLEEEIIAMNALLSQRNLCLQDLRNDLNKVEAERYHLEHEVKQRTEVTERLEEEIIAMNALLSQRNLCLQDLQNDMNKVEAERDHLKHEVKQRNEVTERLEEEILATNTLLSQRNLCLQDLQYDMNKVEAERDHLESMVVMLKEQLEMAQALAEENEAIAMEAHQIAEGRKAYAEDKEEEVKVLERSVEELECTVNALENKVGLVKGEMERQWLQREELQMELEIVRNQTLIVPASGTIWNATESGKTDISRSDKDKLIELQEAEQTIQFLQKEIGDKDAEIIQFKEHINELNMHAEAQAREYKQKFRELEGMARQVKLEPAPSNATSLTSSKAEKSAAKTRGSGSPFKCMGLGITQQINSEKHEELTVARHQIEELEALAASRQKEIFMLNTRLAAAESMTHDVIRDLLGVKLDMANYASLLDHHQTNKEKETPRSDSQVHQANEVSKLKKQLNEFIVERQSWLDEINEKHRELVAARILSEKLRHREQFLTAENEMLKGDTEKYKTIVLELEDKVKKLSSQQNLQHRIHHHAKIKEENNWLKIQTEELSAKLHQSEKILSRVKEELARYRASCGRKPHPDIDEEERLRKELDESEEQRIELAEKLLTLCTAILKAAGLPEPASSITPTVAEHALGQIVRRNNSLEDEVQNLRLQCKVSCEKIRLTELKQQQFSSSDGDSSD